MSLGRYRRNVIVLINVHEIYAVRIISIRTLSGPGPSDSVGIKLKFSQPSR